MHTEKFDVTIALNLAKEVSGQEIAELCAHELGHHLQFLEVRTIQRENSRLNCQEDIHKNEEKHGFFSLHNIVQKFA